MHGGTYPDPIEGLTPGTIIITEETVRTTHMDGAPGGYALLQNQPLPPKYSIPPIELEVLLNDKSYILKCTHKHEKDPNYYYGDFDDLGIPTFDNNPVILVYAKADWRLGTLESGTYTVSAKIPEAKSKILSFPKGRTIVSELSRINKAFGTVSTKKTIIGQLSDIADAAEAGKIGGGDSMIQVIKKEDINNMPDGKHAMASNNTVNVYEPSHGIFNPVTCILCEKVNVDRDHLRIILGNLFDDYFGIVANWSYETLPGPGPDSNLPKSSYFIQKDTPAIYCNESFYIINDPDSLAYIDDGSPK